MPRKNIKGLLCDCPSVKPPTMPRKNTKWLLGPCPSAKPTTMLHKNTKALLGPCPGTKPATMLRNNTKWLLGPCPSAKPATMLHKKTKGLLGDCPSAKPPTIPSKNTKGLLGHRSSSKPTTMLRKNTKWLLGHCPSSEKAGSCDLCDYYKGSHAASLEHCKTMDAEAPAAKTEQPEPKRRQVVYCPDPDCSLQFKDNHRTLFHYKMFHLGVDADDELSNCKLCYFVGDDAGWRKHFVDRHCETVDVEPVTAKTSKWEETKREKPATGRKVKLDVPPETDKEETPATKRVRPEVLSDTNNDEPASKKSKNNVPPEGEEEEEEETEQSSPTTSNATDAEAAIKEEEDEEAELPPLIQPPEELSVEDLIDLDEAMDRLSAPQLLALIREVRAGCSEFNTFARTQTKRDCKFPECKICGFKAPRLYEVTKHQNETHLQLMYPFGCQKRGCHARAMDKEALEGHDCAALEAGEME